MNYTEDTLNEARQIFENALALDTDQQRAAYITEACGDNHTLLNCLKELLHTDGALEAFTQHREDTHWLEQWINHAETKNHALDASRFKVIEKIGEGGMGSVYLCERLTDGVQQRVAVKVLHRPEEDDLSAGRFERERQILAQLNHPNIARFIDADRLPDGRPYVVMEFAPGAPITAYCNAQALNPDQRVRVFLKLCRAVEYAHRNLIIHRDIKPSNVLVDERGDLKLLDFGIAKIEQSDVAGTRTGLHAMTPEYASPEQFRGEVVSVAADVYSLGILLFELITGTRPYTLSECSPVEFERTVSESTAPAASERLLELKNQKRWCIHSASSQVRYLRQVSKDLDRVIAHAMAAEITERYATVADLSDDLQRLLTNQPVKARRPGWLYRSSKFIRRHRLSVTVALAAVLSMASMVTMNLLQNQRIRTERDSALREKQRAEWVSDAFVQAFHDADPTQTLGQDLKAMHVLEQTALQLPDLILKDPQLGSQLALMLSKNLNHMGQQQRAWALLEQVKPVLPQLPQNLQTLYYDEYFYLMIRDERSAQALDELNALPAAMKDTPAFRLVRAQLLTEHREHAQAAQLLQELVAQNAADWPQDLHVRACITLARVLTRTQQQQAALDALLACRAEVQAFDPEVQPRKLYLLSQLAFELGNVYYRMQALDASNEHYTESLAIKQQLFGENHISMAKTYDYLASNISQQGDFATSRDLFQKSIDILTANLGQTNHHLSTTLFNFALHHHRHQQLQQAEELYHKPIELMRLNGLEMHANTAHFYQGLATVQVDTGNLSAAEVNLRRSIEIASQLTPEATVTRLESSLLLADVLHKDARADAARAVLLPVLEEAQQTFPEQHPMHLLATTLASALQDNPPNTAQTH